MSWLKSLRIFLGNQQRLITELPKDTPPEFRQALEAQSAPIKLLMGKLPTEGAADDAPSKDAMELLAGVAQEQYTILAGVPLVIEKAVASGIKAKVDAGELVEKANVTTLVANAEANGRKAGQAAAEMTTKRLAILAGDKLPTGLTPEILGGEEAKFNEVVAEAKRRDGILTTKKIAVPDEGERVRLLYGLPADGFDRTVTMFETMLSGNKGGGGDNPSKTVHPGMGGGAGKEDKVWGV